MGNGVGLAGMGSDWRERGRTSGNGVGLAGRIGGIGLAGRTGGVGLE